MLFGGSFASWSETCAATIVTVHVSSWAKSVSGSSVKVDGPPLTAAVWVPLVVHEMSYHPSDTSTGSEKVTLMLSPTRTPVAPSSGEVALTAGGESTSKGVRWKSSTASPSSAPGAMSESRHRIQNDAPDGIVRPVIVAEMDDRFAAALPSRAPAVAAVFGLFRSREFASAHVPLLRLVASMLIWKSRRSATPRFVA